MIVKIFWQDISEEKQTEIIKAFGDNCNFDVFPITVLESSESEDNVRVIKYAPTKDSEVVNLEMLKAAFPQAYETCVSTAPGASRFTFSKPKSQNTWAKDLLKYGVSQ